MQILHFDNTNLSQAKLKETREKDYPISDRLFWRQSDIFYCENIEKHLIMKIHDDVKKIEVEHNYYSNGRNVPSFFRFLGFKQVGIKSESAAFYHDYLYCNGAKLGITREDADKIFYKLMIYSGVNKYWAYIMYQIVRKTGDRFYQEKEIKQKSKKIK